MNRTVVEAIAAHSGVYGWAPATIAYYATRRNLTSVTPEECGLRTEDMLRETEWWLTETP